jgi:hypothetical protein
VARFGKLFVSSSFVKAKLGQPFADIRPSLVLNASAGKGGMARVEFGS